MHPSAGTTTDEFDTRAATLAAIVQLAHAELPESVSLALVALLSHDDETAGHMLGRLYGEALDAEACYLAQLVNDAILELERTDASSGHAEQ